MYKTVKLAIKLKLNSRQLKIIRVVLQLQHNNN